MVIGFDAKRAFQNNTGLGNYSRMLLCGLASEHQNLRAFLYSPRISGEYAKYFSGYANISTRTPSSIDRFFPDIWRRFGVTVHLSEDKVKLFHGLSHELPHGIPRSIKRVVTMHDLIVWRYPQFYKPLDRVVHRIKQRHSCRIADMVVAISEQTKRDLMEYLHVPESKIRVIYQSCDPMFWEPVAESDIDYVRSTYHLPEKYVICVGTIEERKNQLAVVKAMVATMSCFPEPYAPMASPSGYTSCTTPISRTSRRSMPALWPRCICPFLRVSAFLSSSRCAVAPPW